MLGFLSICKKRNLADEKFFAIAAISCHVSWKLAKLEKEWGALPAAGIAAQ
jgi:hypothetical protein